MSDAPMTDAEFLADVTQQSTYNLTREEFDRLIALARIGADVKPGHVMVQLELLKAAEAVNRFNVERAQVRAVPLGDVLYRDHMLAYQRNLDEAFQRYYESLPK